MGSERSDISEPPEGGEGEPKDTVPEAVYTDWVKEDLYSWREKISGFVCGDLCDDCGDCIYCSGDEGWDGHLCRNIETDYEN